MIDHPNQVTPQGLRDEAFHLSYTGRHHAAQVMRWAADKFEELESLLDEIARLKRTARYDSFGASVGDTVRAVEINAILKQREQT